MQQLVCILLIIRVKFSTTSIEGFVQKREISGERGRLIANRAHFFVQVLCVKICTVGMNQLLTFALIVFVKNLFCFSSLIPDIEFLV